LGKFLLGLIVEGEEGFLFLSNKHEAVVIVLFFVSGQLDVGDQKVIVLILNSSI
jgi:hypothetical protein